MNLAAERLQNPSILVKQVAAEFGFDDPFHFSRAFKNVLGLSPEKFRRLREHSRCCAWRPSPAILALWARPAPLTEPPKSFKMKYIISF